MKELDFDELDKAVNSLMANASVSGQKSEPSEKVLEVPTSTPLDNTPSIPKSPVTPAPTPVRSSVQAPARSTSPSAPAARRGGRFMDVVYPSSTMKKEVPRPVNREATTIQPAKTDDTPVVEGPKVISKTPEPISTDAPIETPKSDWPDPLEMANFSGVDEKKDTPAPKDDLMLETPKPGQSKNDEESPLVSPFLPYTKVEKRPLGSNATQSETPALVPAVDDVDDVDDQLPATLEDTKPLLPEELHSDLVAIESDTTDPEKHEEEKVPDWKPPVSDTPEEDKKPLPPPAEKEKPVIPSGPVSIPQQYKEEKSTGDQENGAIYDTNAYHQPLSHPAKQKSGWMWVVWIVLILVVGAGGGAALYFAGIIR
jgi:hypothetical protein